MTLICAKPAMAVWPVICSASRPPTAYPDAIPAPENSRAVKRFASVSLWEATGCGPCVDGGQSGIKDGAYMGRERGGRGTGTERVRGCEGAQGAGGAVWNMCSV